MTMNSNLSRNFSKKQIKNKNLVPVLNLDPIYNAHSIYVCEQKPEATSPVVVSNLTGCIEAVLITGNPDIFLLQGYWLSAGSRSALKIILDELEKVPAFTVNYPIWADDIMQQRFPGGDFQTDNLCVLTGDQLNPSCAGSSGAVKLTRSLYDTLSNNSEFKKQILPGDLLPESAFYCITERDRLCSIGEHILETSEVSVISQMYTLEQYRGKGFATQVAGALTRAIRRRKKIPVAFFCETNLGSKRVFQRLGYTLHSRLGWLNDSSR